MATAASKVILPRKRWIRFEIKREQKSKEEEREFK